MPIIEDNNSVVGPEMQAIRFSTLFANESCAAVKQFALKCVTIKHYRS